MDGDIRERVEELRREIAEIQKLNLAGCPGAYHERV